MKIIIPQIKHQLDLAAYDSAFSGQQIDIWVNPPSEELYKVSQALMDAANVARQLRDLDPEKDAEKIAQLTQELEGCGVVQQQFIALVTGWSMDDVKGFIEESIKTDPRLWSWFLLQARSMVFEHQASTKKV